MELRDDMTVYILTSEARCFVGAMELASERKWFYAFTSPEKAKTFLRMARQKGLLEKANRLFPCTLAEWFEMQEKHHLPDLALDPDPEQHRDYPMLVGDTAKHNITCVTTTLPNGASVYRVAVSSRSDT